MNSRQQCKDSDGASEPVLALIPRSPAKWIDIAAKRRVGGFSGAPKIIEGNVDNEKQAQEFPKAIVLKLRRSGEAENKTA